MYAAMNAGVSSVLQEMENLALGSNDQYTVLHLNVRRVRHICHVTIMFWGLLWSVFVSFWRDVQVQIELHLVRWQIRHVQVVLVKCKHKYKLKLYYVQGGKYKHQYKLHVPRRRQVQSSDPGAVTSLLLPPFLSQQLKLI